MAGTFVATGAYTNLTRLELEQLRKADFFAGEKALTVGDSAYGSENQVGPGNINAEPYLTGQFIPVNDLLLQPVPQPGLSLFNQTANGGATASIVVTTVVTLTGLTPKVFSGPGNYITISGAASPSNNGTFPITGILSATSVTINNPNAVTDGNNGALDWRLVQDSGTWYGPTVITGGVGPGSTGHATGALQWTDAFNNFTTSGVLAGDILVVKSTYLGANLNQFAVATISVVATHALTLSVVNNSASEPGSPTQLHVDSDLYGYVIIRPKACQLFAVPGSGATGFEQSFLAVIPTSTLHSNLAPTVDQINADRVLNLIPGQFGLNSTVDRADAVFSAPAPASTLDLLGYRIVLYPDNGTGTGPNLATPIATLNPVIDPSIPSTDQRFTVDFSAGVIRFSCEPQLGGQIKVAGGVNATTGRLNLYAVFWAMDSSFAPGSTTGLYVPQVLEQVESGYPLKASRVYWNGVTWAFDTLVPTSGGNFTTPLAGSQISGNASLTPTGTTSVTVGELTGMYPGLVGSNLVITGATIAVNNGTFPITVFTNFSQVSITNAAFGGATITNGLNFGGVVQLVTTLPTGLQTGDVIFLVGINGTGVFTTLSGFSYTITVQDSTHFTLNGTVFSGGYISGGTVLDNGAQTASLTYFIVEPAVNITTMETVDPTASVIRRLNTVFEAVCGDGTVSFGDFNGADAVTQAYTYWTNLSPQPLTCRIHAKRGTYDLNGTFFVGYNGSTSTAGYELIITGDGRSSTIFNVNTNIGPPPKFAFVGAGSQLTLENLFLDDLNSFGIWMGGSLRMKSCYSTLTVEYGVLDAVSGLTTGSETQAPSYLVICDDCILGSWTFQGAFAGSGFAFRNCAFPNVLGAFSFATASTNSSWKHFMWDRCNFNVVGVPTINATNIDGGGGIISVNYLNSSYDLTMTLDEFFFEDCHVSSADTSSDSVVLLHLFPYAWNASGSNTPARVQIGTVTIRGGTWSLPQGRGNDFVPFFLMCSNPVIENLKLVGGGTGYTGQSAAPGFRGNGWYTTQMMLALSGTIGWQFEPTLTVSPCAFATIAASGNAIFNSKGDDFGFIEGFSGGVVTFSDINASLPFPAFSPGMVGMLITIEGAANSANNGTFVLTSSGGTACQYTNAAGVFPDANSGSIVWNIASSSKSGLTVRNLSVQNMPLGSSSGDLCLVGPPLNGGSVDVDGVFVTNNGGVSNIHIPMHRIHIRPGAVWEPISSSLFSPGTFVTTSTTLPTGTIHVNSTSGFHTVSGSSGQASLLINGTLVQYTGTTSTTFTGCTGGSGSITSGVTPVVQAMQSVVPGTGGSNGTFRGITWQALNGIDSPSSDGVGYVTFFGNGYNSSGIVSLAYTGDLHVEDVKVLTLPSFYPARSFGQQFDVVTNTGITCTELWGTYFSAEDGGFMSVPLASRGRLRIRNCYVEGCGQDGWGGVPAINTGGSQAILVGTSSIITLSDFLTIDASSLEVFSNMQNNPLGNNLQVSGIQVLQQFSQRGGFNGVAAVFSTPTLTWEGLSGMTPADVDSYLLISGSSHSGNNGVFLITAVLSATSVQVSNSSGATGISECAWAIANNLVAAWNLTNNVARFIDINTDDSIVGIASYWTLGTAQVAVAGESTVISNGTLSGNYVNMTTGSTFSAGQVVPYALQSIDQNGGGQMPAVVFLGNTGVETNDSGPFAGVTWLNYYAATTATAVTPGNQARGFLTAFTTGQGTYGNGSLMIFNAGSLKTP